MAGYWWFYAAICVALTVVMFRRFIAVADRVRRAATFPVGSETSETGCAGGCAAAGVHLAFFPG